MPPNQSPSSVMGRKRASLADNAIVFPVTDHQDTSYGTVIRIVDYNFNLTSFGGPIGANNPVTPVINQTITGHVFLPLPQQLLENTSHQYNTADFGIIGASIGLGKLLTSDSPDGEAILGQAAAVGARPMRSGVQAISSDAGGAWNAVTNTVPNPFSMASYERTNSRVHNFDWTLTPQSPEDSEAIRNLINTLRYHSLPGLTQGVLSFPSVFQLAFTGTDYLFGMSNCFLRDISVNYSPHNSHSFFGDTYAPTSVNLQTVFMEIEPLTRASYETGNQQPVRF